jgi:hypothetical protein
MRVISVTPAGRRRYLAALVPHLLRQRHVIAEHHWWLNTTDEADARYVEQVTAQHPDFFRICRKAIRPDLTLSENIWGFFRDYSEPGTLYLRFDDDIVYFHADAVENLVRFRLAHRQPLLILGNIVNNAVCTHFHQRAGLVPMAWGQVHNECLDCNGWARGGFARRLHERFLQELRHGRLERWKQVALPIEGARRFSINVISWLGEDLCGVPEIAIDNVDEERFLTETLPARLGRPNAACSNALFAHFAFYTQRTVLEWTWPELVGHYQAIAEQRPAVPRNGEAVLKLVRNVHWRIRKYTQRLRARRRQRRLRRQAA